MELYSYFRSSCAYRVRIALNLKNIELSQLVPMNLLHAEHRDEAYLDRNPQGLVPSLILDDGTTLTQSIAILEWLETAHPDPALLPADHIEAARVRAWVNAIASDIQPIDNLRVLNYLNNEMKASDEDKDRWYAHWIQLGFEKPGKASHRRALLPERTGHPR